MISKQEVKHIAKLARLGINEQECRKFQKELSAILDYFNLLEEVDVSNVKPTFHSAEDLLNKKFSITRKDVANIENNKIADKLLKAAPDRKDRYVKVKKIL
ncbi:MAG: Asp-tRNA(Asn)/Glu-tRNA(Gln) amidotransferase subunit GatC [Patescibacteria group bacterium]|nr:Asp-tRNA(Asn)/Glu-tRNA(Gln) amidotransferase subunit GatC [Patescibacteria group bacterium]